MAEVYGWVGKILKVDLTTGKIWTEDTTKYADYLGGRGIAARIAWNEISSGVSAFNPENRLIIMAGTLTGTPAPTSGRTIVCGIGPQCYPESYTRSSIGGWFGAELKYAGFDGIVVQGRSDKPVYLWIHDGVAEIKDAGDLWGMDTFATMRMLQKVHKDTKIRTLCIGPAGENLVRITPIQSDTENAAGQGGFGAVMGSKKLKAIVARGHGAVKVAKPTEFLGLSKEIAKLHYWATVKSGQEFPPDYAYDGFYYSPTGETVVNVYKNYKYERKPIACTHACSNQCATFFKNIPGKVHPGVNSGIIMCVAPFFQKWEMHPLEPPWTYDQGIEGGFETRDLADKLGINHWDFICGMAPFVWYCKNAGYIKDEDLGVEINLNKTEFWVTLLEDVAYRRKLGDILAEGAPRAADKLGKGQEFIKKLYPARGHSGHWDGRGIHSAYPFPFWVISTVQWATDYRDPFNSGHGSMWMWNTRKKFGGYLEEDQVKAIAKKVYGTDTPTSLDYTDKHLPAIYEQHKSVIKDSVSLCDWVFPIIATWVTPDGFGDPSAEYKLFAACTGLAMTEDEFNKAVERIFNLERALLVRNWSRKRADDELAIAYFRDNPDRTDGTTLDEAKFKELLDKYYDVRGWDKVKGWPTRAKLEQLGLKDIADELAKLGKLP